LFNIHFYARIGISYCYFVICEHAKNSLKFVLLPEVEALHGQKLSREESFTDQAKFSYFAEDLFSNNLRHG